MVRRNLIYDGSKNGGNGVAYQAFMKSNGKGGVFESNVVLCSRNVPNRAKTDYRIGISFGGGGTSPDTVCEEGTCNPEHRDGVMRNNVILNCNDAGIYMNECQNCRVYHNLLYNTNGIDVRFESSVVDVANNLIGSGNVRERDGSTLTESNNAKIGDAAIQNIFANPSQLRFGVDDLPASRTQLAVGKNALVDKDLCSMSQSNIVGPFALSTSPCLDGFASFFTSGQSATTTLKPSATSLSPSTTSGPTFPECNWRCYLDRYPDLKGFR